MTAVETLEKRETEFGYNNFLQVARKVAKMEDGEDVEFVALTRGHLDARGRRRYKTNLTIPPDEELYDFLVDAIEAIRGGEA